MNFVCNKPLEIKKNLVTLLDLAMFFGRVSTLRNNLRGLFPVNTKHLYNIYTMLAQRRRGLSSHNKHAVAHNAATAGGSPDL